MDAKPKELTREYFLTAGETDAQGRMPITLVIERAIEIATEHANILGIGYARLIESNVGWVLTRLSVQMYRYPRINDRYSFTTWIESYNRLYSDRCYMICDADGNTIGEIRSMWVAIDMQKRTAADLTEFEKDSFPIGDRKCSVPMQRKLPKLGADAQSTQYTFRYSDIDFNRHVNTVQYVRHVLNQWSLSFFDAYQIKRFDIAFHQESYYGETVDILKQEADGHTLCEIVKNGQRAVAADLEFQERENYFNQ